MDREVTATFTIPTGIPVMLRFPAADAQPTTVFVVPRIGETVSWRTNFAWEYWTVADVEHELHTDDSGFHPMIDIHLVPKTDGGAAT